MPTYAGSSQENKSQSEVNTVAKKQDGGETSLPFVDNRPEAVAQRKLQEMANNSPQVSQLRALQQMANSSTHAKRTALLPAAGDTDSAQQRAKEQAIKSQHVVQAKWSISIKGWLQSNGVAMNVFEDFVRANYEHLRDVKDFNTKDMSLKDQEEMKTHFRERNLQLHIPVPQGKYIVTNSQSGLSTIGAATCLVVSIKDSTNGIYSLAHLDGSADVANTIKNMLRDAYHIYKQVVKAPVEAEAYFQTLNAKLGSGDFAPPKHETAEAMAARLDAQGYSGKELRDSANTVLRGAGLGVSDLGSGKTDYVVTPDRALAPMHSGGLHEDAFRHYQHLSEEGKDTQKLRPYLKESLTQGQDQRYNRFGMSRNSQRESYDRETKMYNSVMKV